MASGDFTRVKVTPTFYRDLDDERFERAVVFEPGYSDPGPRGPQWCGKHGMDIRFMLRGPKGVTQFLMFTGWVPGEEGVDPRISDLYPTAADIGYHARVEQYEDQWGQEECEYLGAPCFYDGSGLAAEAVMERFLTDGEPAVWRALRERHDLIKES